MSDERKQSLFIYAYQGRDTADTVYDELRAFEKADKIDIKTAATVYRKDNGKLKLKHHRRVTVKKGAFGGAAIGLLLAGLTGGASVAGGALAGALVGGLLGTTRSRQRRDAKKYLDDKLGPNDSALVILVSDADWAFLSREANFGGEEISVELTPEAEQQIAALAENDEVVEAVQDEVEVEEVTEE